MTAVERLLQTARNEIGYLEKSTNSNLDSKTGNAGSNNYTKYARDLDNIGNIYNGKKNGYAWCDVFVDWCFIKTFGIANGMKLLCQSYGGAGAGCTYSAQYYKNKGQFYKSNPKAGDQIFFTGGDGMSHTGIVEKVSGGRVYTIEGNTSSASGVIANGGAVASKSYNLNYSRIGGYGRPDWSLVSGSNSTTTNSNSATPSAVVTTVNYKGKVVANGGLNCRTSPVSGNVIMTYANGITIVITKESNGWGYTGKGWVCLKYVKKISDAQTSTNTNTNTNTPVKQQPTVTPIIKEEDEDMTLDTFKNLMQEYRAELQDNDCGTWSQDARQWAIDNGLTNGTGKTANGEVNYAWEDVLTREQAVTLFYRFAQLIKFYK